jgi:hypothetical protein
MSFSFLVSSLHPVQLLDQVKLNYGMSRSEQLTPAKAVALISDTNPVYFTV